MNSGLASSSGTRTVTRIALEENKRYIDVGIRVCELSLMWFGEREEKVMILEREEK